MQVRMEFMKIGSPIYELLYLHETYRITKSEKKKDKAHRICVNSISLYNGLVELRVNRDQNGLLNDNIFDADNKGFNPIAVMLFMMQL